jgi:hypothetical protein
VLVKIAAHGMRRTPGQPVEDITGNLMTSACGSSATGPQDRQRRVEIACDPFSIRAIVTAGDECRKRNSEAFF